MVGISVVMCAFSAAGKRTWPSDVIFALANYINDPNLIRCSVAVGTNAEIQGFKSLKRATQGNSYHVPVGWGIVGAHIDLSAAQRGLGRAVRNSTCGSYVRN